MSERMPEVDPSDAEIQAAEELIDESTKDEIANCAKVLALALTLSQNGERREPHSTELASADLIEAHFPAAMETLAAVLKEVREESASPTLH